MKEFAAFIITYERSQILKNTIQLVFKQSRPPETLLIVDNSTSEDTEILLRSLSLKEPRLQYHKVGMNSGPAGGAYWGLSILAKQGYSFIQWIDDDDPPNFENVNEKMLALFTEHQEVGIVGQVGSRFNWFTGKLERIKDSELINSSHLDVDFIGGNQLMIVRGELIFKDCLPDKDLFFGFEDLSFCLKVKSAGYRILVPSDLFLDLRKYHSRLGKVSLISNASWRSYYSIRSIILICLYQQKLFFPIIFITGKLFYDFLMGKGALKLKLKGYVDGLTGKKGMTISPLAK